jgi:translation elongation factor EF-1alpha
MIDKRTLEKYEKDAKEAGRDSWYLSWALDTNAEERAKVLRFVSFALLSPHRNRKLNFFLLACLL